MVLLSKPLRPRINASLSSQPFSLVSPGGSIGYGRHCFNHLNKGWAAFPFTLTFPKRWASLRKPFPGRTYVKAFLISLFFSLVWCPNWLQKTPMIFSWSPNSLLSLFIASKSLTVVPQRVAQLRIKVGFPRNIDMAFALSSRSASVKSWKRGDAFIAPICTSWTTGVVYFELTLAVRGVYC